MTKPLVVGLGEVLWDFLKSGEKRLGGAPANFARGVVEASGGSLDVALVSALGPDALGHEAVEGMTRAGVNCSQVVVSDAPTAASYVGAAGAEEATYLFTQDCAFDDLPTGPAVDQLASRTAAAAFGTLAQRSEASRRATPPASNGGLRIGAGDAYLAALVSALMQGRSTHEANAAACHFAAQASAS